MNQPVRDSFRTSDGVELSWLESGEGPTLLMLPGWSQSAAMFKEQIAGLSGRFHCLALDHRGHGESGRPGYGYRISRLAQDVREFIQHRKLDEITLLGHSMGASVMWGYWDLFGGDRLVRMVIDDEPSVLTLKDTESTDSAEDAGEIFPWPTLVETCDSLVSPDPIGLTKT
ncbi:MAG: alpha/beta hydrolase, partial [Phycisphaerales bacterium]